MRNKLWVAVVLSLILAWPAGRARAHAELIASEPAAGAELAAAPAMVRLSFTDGLAPSSTIQVLDGQFRDVTAGAAAVDAADPAVLTVALQPLPAGDYTVQYEAVDPDDGHVVTGSIAFRVIAVAAAPTATGAATAAPTTESIPPTGAAPAVPTATPPPPARPPWFYFLVGFVAVVGMLAFSVLRRRPPPPSPPLMPDDDMGEDRS